MYGTFLVLVFASALVPETSSDQGSVVTVTTTITSKMSQCKNFKGRTEFRCLKSNYQADSLLVRSYSNHQVTFKIGKWYSKCGKPGRNYSNQQFNIGARSSLHLQFESAGNGMCNELYIHSCWRQNKRVNCADVITVNPA